jgi:hypothetical protein
MKYLTIAALMTSTAFAQTITGVPVLKGSLKTKVMVRGINTTCKVKVERIRNLKEEDSFQNPGYKVTIDTDLDGRNSDGEKVIRFGKQFVLTNLWPENGQIVAKDFEYFSEDGAVLTIKPDGRMRTFTIPLDNQKITCSF